MFDVFIFSSSAAFVPKSGKGRSPPARRSTVDDKHTLVCVENGDLVKTAKLASGDYKTGSRVTVRHFLCVLLLLKTYIHFWNHQISFVL